MQLSNLLGTEVVDAAHHRVGTVVDVRLRIAGDRCDHPDTSRGGTGRQPPHRLVVSGLRADGDQRPGADREDRGVAPPRDVRGGMG